VLDVMGTVDPEAIRARVRDVDPAAHEVFFFTASVGALVGVRRRDGSRVAVKFHKLVQDVYFEDLHRVQSALADAGYPAPRPLGRVGNATIEEWLDAGSFRDAHDPEVRSVMARELVRFHSLATAVAARPRRPFFPLGSEALWPVPHNALFDFDATSDGAEWIDEIARAARPLRDACNGPEVVGHTDWSAKHLRFDEALRPTAVYDWDSLDTQPEPLLVGNAAGSFTYTEELDQAVFPWPSVNESLAFIDEYESARGAAFEPVERRGAEAACLYLRAYAARCGHAVGDDARHASLAALADAVL
jgi:hypothetical protein